MPLALPLSRGNRNTIINCTWAERTLWSRRGSRCNGTRCSGSINHNFIVSVSPGVLFPPQGLRLSLVCVSPEWSVLVIIQLHPSPIDPVCGGIYWHWHNHNRVRDRLVIVCFGLIILKLDIFKFQRHIYNSTQPLKFQTKVRDNPRENEIGSQNK